MGLVANRAGSNINVAESIVEMFQALASAQCSIGGYQVNNVQFANLPHIDEDEKMTWTSSLQVIYVKYIIYRICLHDVKLQVTSFSATSRPLYCLSLVMYCYIKVQT